MTPAERIRLTCDMVTECDQIIERNNRLLPLHAQINIDKTIERIYKMCDDAS